MLAGKQSNAYSRSPRTPTSYGRATTTALRSALPSIKPARRRRRLTPASTTTITTNMAAIDEGLRRMKILEIKAKGRRLKDFYYRLTGLLPCIVQKTIGTCLGWLGKGRTVRVDYCFYFFVIL